MKISILTVTLNSQTTIASTLFSVFQQTYKNIEHILVDGGSTDETQNIIKKHKLKNKKFFNLSKSNIYSAINFAVKKSTGDYIIILNSDDILNDKDIIKKIVHNLKNKKKDTIFLADVTYFESNKFAKTLRYYSAKNFKSWMFIFGLMPPHPGAIIPKTIAKNNYYDTRYLIASDFDFFVRTIHIQKTNYQALDFPIIRMRTGGVSGKNLMSHIKTTEEIYLSLKRNGLFFSYFFVTLRFIVKSLQINIFNKYNNKKFTVNKYYKKLIESDLKVISKIQIVNFNKNFVLSALNLAFLGNYFFGKIRAYKELMLWPDGVFSKTLFKSLKKIPGRDLLKKIKLNNEIKKIVILGNLPDASREYLKKKFDRDIVHYNLPFGSINKIKKKFKYKSKKNEIIFITLPTPKQEQLAEYIRSQNKNYKIICIGGSINIAAGIEKSVPKILYQFEFLWRLRYEPLRRSKRLILTFFYYYWGKLILGKGKNLITKVIK